MKPTITFKNRDQFNRVSDWIFAPGDIIDICYSDMIIIFKDDKTLIEQLGCIVDNILEEDLIIELDESEANYSENDLELEELKISYIGIMEDWLQNNIINSYSIDIESSPEYSRQIVLIIQSSNKENKNKICDWFGELTSYINSKTIVYLS